MAPSTRSNLHAPHTPHAMEDAAPGVVEHIAPSSEASLSAFCPRFHHAVELVGRRWTGAILRAMLSGRVRFSDLAATVPGLSDRLLSERLKELGGEGLIQRLVDGSRVEYHLTPKGRELTPVIESLSAWAEAWLPPAQPPSVGGDDADRSGEPDA